MITMTVMPRATDDWTVDDLDTSPDDGLRYELLGGLLLVSPAPKPIHQDAIREIFLVLHGAGPKRFKVYFAPVDWRPDRHTSLQPDVLVVPREEVGERNITAPLTLAVEVISPSTRRKDELLKLSKYAEAGVASYWIIDPDEPSLVAYDLVDDGYVVASRAYGDESITLENPFPAAVVPRSLVTT